MADPERGALKLVIILAITFLGAGLISVALYFLDCSAHHIPSRPVIGALRAWPALVGVICLIKSRAIAAWLSDLLAL